jgi:glycosyltransferase involved in cell wall biosynthesis
MLASERAALMLAARQGESVPDSVSVVLCAYTDARWPTLRDAVGMAQKQLRPDDELIVVVDYNESLMTRCLESFGDCLILANNHRIGVSGARNTALDKASGSIIVFIDDDAVPADGWLDLLRAPYADGNVRGVGGLVEPCWSGGEPRWFPEEFRWVVGCSWRGLPTRPEPVRNLIGANMSFRKSVFDQVGGFAEEMGRIRLRPLGCEETDLSIRLTLADPDGVLLYVPASQVVHTVTQVRGSVRYFASRCWSEGLSKAELSRRVGRAPGLSAERAYTSRVLPAGVWRGLSQSAGGDFWGAARSGAIMLGLAVTAAGYCAGAYLRRSGRHEGK